ncbi:DMT family transporter [Ovoidimarina sediminis]|uniref:DMT family transporter n=1 Tax=Ovoidimarina sediminis TaxID=3079856 RepID=UPI002912BB37|nr:DMT family transporter [Rhodophyticola sp. MJ-SS7]MDU8945671.1 DMT family transporter [Rhodophyticola sp. MJ-SS7]
MEKRDRIDAFGAVSLICFSVLLGFNQVFIKVVNDGLQPVFFAGLRSAGSVLCLGLWIWVRGIGLRPTPGVWPAGVAAGAIFAFEFLLLFIALDLTTVARTSVIFYSMPVWMALGGHLLIPGERLTLQKSLGLLLAFAGVVWAILNRSGGSAAEASLMGDLFALAAAMGWAAVGLIAKGSRLKAEPPERQLLWQVTVSAPILLVAAFFFGPFVRDLQPIHLWGLAFQIVILVSAGFAFWFWLLSIYPAASVAAFSFLAPIFGVALGWLLLDEPIGPALLGALALVALGLWVMNRPPRQRPGQVPQKV